MANTIQAGWRAALSEITTRRTMLGASAFGAAGLLGVAHDVDAKKKKKRKKPCKKLAKRCGKGCCKAPSICSAASCFCSGNEGNCKSIPQELIDIIADALGKPSGEVGANPDQPLAQCPDIAIDKKLEINELIEKGFGVTGPVAWCEGGINAGVEDILGEITIKA